MLGNGIKIGFARIPAGKYVNAFGEEVTIPRSYWMSVDEITNEQYRRIFPRHDSKLERGEFMQFTEQERGYPLNRPTQPVVRVSYLQAKEYCKRLSKQCNAKVRLPTGNEWEWGARAGKATPLWYGDIDVDFSKLANLADKTFRRQDRFRAQIPGMAVPPWRPADERYDDGFRVTAPVDHFQCNAWGLRNVQGNVWEWTADLAPALPGAQHVVLPKPKPDTTKYAVARGGSCWCRPKNATFAARLQYRQWQRIHDIGFRILVED